MHRSEDVNAVRHTAERLNISEFEVFSAAYKAWFQERAPTASLERHFVAYLFHGRVPFWVRHFTRSTPLAQAASEGLLTRGIGEVCVEIIDLAQLALEVMRRPSRLCPLPHTHRLIA